MWPALPLEDWKETYASLHRYAQMIGKVQLALTPRTNHFWNVAFTVTPRGLFTGAIPRGDASFSMELDLLDHNLVVRTSDKATRALALVPRTVADFHRELLAILAALEIEVKINDRPVEMQEELIRFSDDRRHSAYDPEPVERCLQILQQSAAALEEFRARFVGKASPVQFYWGSFDLSASRFSGRRAPPRIGADAVTRESYSQEVFCCGFWPGDARFPAPAFYAYVSPAPAQFSTVNLIPVEARWQPSMGEFLLPYDEVRSTAHPRATLLAFFQSAYEAAADLGRWDRVSLEAPMSAPQPPETHTLH